MAFSKSPVRKFDVGELGFMVGAWRGESDEDIFEEHWMQPIEDNMTGMFRWLKKGEIFVYEIMAFVKQDNNVRFFLRHFSKSFEGWEEKTSPMILLMTELKGKQAIFVREDQHAEGYLLYERLDESTLRFADLESDGSISFELVFNKI
jgi:hypothetical protein